MFPDKPFDNESGRPLSPEADSLRVRFKYYQKLQHTHTTEDYKAAFLQRLANPLEPFHVTRNPYITVDWSTIDLTVFNGEDERKRSEFQSVGEVFDPFDDPADDDNPTMTTQSTSTKSDSRHVSVVAGHVSSNAPDTS